MRYLPHTDEDIAEMLKAVGKESLDALFSTIPEACRRRTDLELPEALTEWELNDIMGSLAGSMAVSPEYRIFLGAGSYEHFIPASVTYLLERSEFSTAYTPYQPEISQGTLQAVFEYQTLVAALLGMDIANASLYDGASALAEALLMAARVSRRQKVALSSLIHPLYRRVVRTYLEPAGFEILELPYAADGRTDLNHLGNLDDLAAIAVQSPNTFGCIEDLAAIGNLTRGTKTLFIASFTEPLAYGLYKSPGSQGADIACGEGQSFGIPQSYGGPGLGMFACLKPYLRSMPGRLVGQTTDREGKRGFVLTLATREQHIRREKATSNICTNSSLCAVTSAMYMASLGGTGLRELAKLNYDKTEYLKKELNRAGFKTPFAGPTFNEFVVEFPVGFECAYQRLLDQNIVAGLPLGRYYPELPNGYLLCVTETKTREDLDTLVARLSNP
ncbi:glycine dehydrogenase (decarboxylating) alpha subunit [Syntrophus gentianae]|uniref:Probable glycine dehydrogenase (decarboxylating) subunit 1 n=1 Tax=Syntrophus gentianae TaxID=43775 RepID=A0A1H7Y2H4_9BACT|nr:aminomethyl-transferring glycine dehydrogenase subunit GcvPA [Syntrophus gentianae]SEM40064.1 glycine dehydrogenase (decarboxylating) alpha subunit [Syntrophus gentianae]